MSITDIALATLKEREAVFSPLAAIPAGFHSSYHGSDASDYPAPDLQVPPTKRQKPAYLEEAMSEEASPETLCRHISDLVKGEVEDVELISSHAFCALLHNLQGKNPNNIEKISSIEAEVNNKIWLDNPSGRTILVTSFIQGQWQTALLFKEREQQPAVLFYVKERKCYAKIINAEMIYIDFTNIKVYTFHFLEDSYITESQNAREIAQDTIMSWDIN